MILGNKELNNEDVKEMCKELKSPPELTKEQIEDFIKLLANIDTLDLLPKKKWRF